MLLGQIVRVKDVKKLENDEQLEDSALNIMKENDYTGEITKIEDGINFVGFRNDTGWVTQGFKDEEIEVV